MAPIDDATSRFLEAAAADLQAQIGIAGAVVQVRVGGDVAGIGLVASIRIGKRVVEVHGRGDSLVTAYADLRRASPEPILAAAYSEVVSP